MPLGSALTGQPRKWTRLLHNSLQRMPLTLFKQHLNRHPVPDWLHQQVYLHPYPKELMLQNHM
jgi:uncharacterized protein YbgA (DUF1722 family)